MFTDRKKIVMEALFQNHMWELKINVFEMFVKVHRKFSGEIKSCTIFMTIKYQ